MKDDYSLFAKPKRERPFSGRPSAWATVPPERSSSIPTDKCLLDIKGKKRDRCYSSHEERKTVSGRRFCVGDSATRKTFISTEISLCITSQRDKEINLVQLKCTEIDCLWSPLPRGALCHPSDLDEIPTEGEREGGRERERQRDLTAHTKREAVTGIWSPLSCGALCHP